MKHEQVASALNLFAQNIAIKTNKSFDHTIVVSTETGGGRYRLTQGRKVIVHPDQISNGTPLLEIIRDLISLTAARDEIANKFYKNSVRAYKKSGKEAIEFLQGHLSFKDFQTWIEKTAGLY